MTLRTLEDIWKSPLLALGMFLCLLAACQRSAAPANDDPQRIAELAEQLVTCQNARDALRERVATERPQAAAALATVADPVAPGTGGAPRAAELAARLAQCQGQQVALQQALAAPPSADVPANAAAAPIPGEARPANGAVTDPSLRAAQATRAGVAKLGSPLAAASGLNEAARQAGTSAAPGAGRGLKGMDGAAGGTAQSGALNMPDGLRAGRIAPLSSGPHLTPVVPHSRPNRAPPPMDSAEEAKAVQGAAVTFRGNASQLKVCYERSLKRNVNLQYVHQVQVQLTVGPEGLSHGVRLSPRTDADLEDCIGRTVSRWAFPRYRGGLVTVEIPLGLRALGN